MQHLVQQLHEASKGFLFILQKNVNKTHQKIHPLTIGELNLLYIKIKFLNFFIYLLPANQNKQKSSINYTKSCD